MVKGIIHIFGVIDSLLHNPDGLHVKLIKSATSSLLESVQLLASANHEINYRRKDNFRRALPQNMYPVCSYSRDVTTYLFGDDVTKTLTDISATNQALKAPKMNRSK